MLKRKNTNTIHLNNKKLKQEEQKIIIKNTNRLLTIQSIDPKQQFIDHVLECIIKDDNKEQPFVIEREKTLSGEYDLDYLSMDDRITKIKLPNDTVIELNSRKKETIPATILIIQYPKPLILLIPDEELNPTTNKLKREENQKILFFLNEASLVSPLLDKEKREQAISDCRLGLYHDEDYNYEDHIVHLVLKDRLQAFEKIDEWFTKFDINAVEPSVKHDIMITYIYPFCSPFIGRFEKEFLEISQKKSWFKNGYNEDYHSLNETDDEESSSSDEFYGEGDEQKNNNKEQIVN